jgi:hypothetical protein
LLCGQVPSNIDDPCYQGALPTGVPTYAAGSGPLVRIDETHCNKHRAGIGYKGFKKLLTSDGYDVRTLIRRWQPSCQDPLPSCTCDFCEDLGTTEILVIVNPVYPIFAPEAILIEQWVAQGGSLMLVLDHCPFRGYASALIEKLGTFTWPEDQQVQGSNVNVCASSDFSGTFCRGAGCPAGQDHGAVVQDGLTEGRGCAETVENVEHFTGSWISSSSANASLRYPQGALAEVNQQNTCNDVGETAAGIWFHHGAGRVYFGAEAAMFTAPCHGSGDLVTCGSRSCAGPYGLQPGHGNENEQYALNVIHWLDGLTPVACPDAYPCPVGCSVDPESYSSTGTCRSSCQGPQDLFACGGAIGGGSLMHIVMENYDCDCGGTSQGFVCQ